MHTKHLIVRDKGEWGEFFVAEREPTPRDNGSLSYSASWTCLSSFGVYGHHWSCMGRPFVEFIQDISADYLLGKIGRKELCDEKMVKEIKRLIGEGRKEKRYPTEIARAALESVKSLASEFDGQALAAMLYRDVALSRVRIEWCDISTQEYDGQCRGFAAKIWPLFVKEIAAIQAASL